MEYALRVGGDILLCSDEKTTGEPILWLWARVPGCCCAVMMDWYRDVPVRVRLPRKDGQTMLTGIKSGKGGLDLTYEDDGVVLRGDHVTMKWLTTPEVKPPSLPDPSSEAMMFVVEPTSFRGINGRLLLHWDSAVKALRYGPTSVEADSTPTPLRYVLSAVGPWPDHDLAFQFDAAAVRLLKAACMAGTAVNAAVERGTEDVLLRLSVRSDERGVVCFTVVDGVACPFPPRPVPERTVIDMMQDVEREAGVNVPDSAPVPQQPVAEVTAAPDPARALEPVSEAQLQRAYDQICAMVRDSEHARDEIDTHFFWTQVDSCYEASLLYRELTQIRRGTRVRDTSGAPVPAFHDKFGRDVGVSASTVRIWLYCAAIPPELRAEMPEPLLRHTRLCRDLARLKGSIEEFGAVIRAFRAGGYREASATANALLGGSSVDASPETDQEDSEAEEEDAEAEKKARAAQGKRRSKTTGADLRLATGEEHDVHLEGIKLTFTVEPMIVGRSELEALLRESDDLQLKVSGIVAIHVAGKLKR
ncbi:MAG TPA: hypothetical protein PLI95_22765 [Polyangiaceae bacterium]|nr:hypothetical protein [Polyangiaceae bacterium]